MRNYIAVILAAGMGTRLGEQDAVPKCLLQIGGKRLLTFQLDFLDDAGFREVVIVVGYKKEQVREYFGGEYKNLRILYVANQHYSSSGSAYSFLLTESIWRKYRQSILMLHADLLYEERILIDALEDDRENLIVLDESFDDLTGDELIVTGKQGRVEALYKGPKDKENVQGESLGINKWSTEYLEHYYRFLTKYIGQFGRDSNWEPSISSFLLDHPEVKLEYSLIYGKYWININYQSDVEYAADIVLDKIRG